MIVATQRYFATLHYGESVRKAWILDHWRRLLGKRLDLIPFDVVAKRVKARQRPAQQLEYVPLRQIVGSVGRVRDFTREFLPRPCIDEQRWARLDEALNARVDLPPVDLYRIGDVYFVNDGHHRTSVARANGFQGIEAYVTEMEAAVWLMPEDFDNGQWLVKTQHLISEEEWSELERQQKEDPMYDPFIGELAKIRQQELLEEAERMRLANKVAANQPSYGKRLRAQVGNYLIDLGNRLKAPYPASPDTAPYA